MSYKPIYFSMMAAIAGVLGFYLILSGIADLEAVAEARRHGVQTTTKLEEVRVSMYEYNAEVIRWVDGDTVELLVDMGFGIFRKAKFRLKGVDTPERGQPDFDLATDTARQLAPEGSVVRIRSFKEGKYGRYIIDICTAEQLPDHPDGINQVLIQKGWVYNP